jgi:hypothetical protein
MLIAQVLPQLTGRFCLIASLSAGANTPVRRCLTWRLPLAASDESFFRPTKASLERHNDERHFPTSAAITRIKTSGFMNTCKRSGSTAWCCVAAGSFGPNRSSRDSASWAVKPIIATRVHQRWAAWLGFPVGHSPSGLDASGIHTAI